MGPYEVKGSRLTNDYLYDHLYEMYGLRAGDVVFFENIWVQRRGCDHASRLSNSVKIKLVN